MGWEMYEIGSPHWHGRGRGGSPAYKQQQHLEGSPASQRSINQKDSHEALMNQFIHQYHQNLRQGPPIPQTGTQSSVSYNINPSEKSARKKDHSVLEPKSDYQDVDVSFGGPVNVDESHLYQNALPVQIENAPQYDDPVHYSRLGYYGHDYENHDDGQDGNTGSSIFDLGDVALPGLCSRINLPSPTSDWVSRDLSGATDLSFLYEPITRAMISNDGIALDIASVDGRGNERGFGEISDRGQIGYDNTYNHHPPRSFQARDISITMPSHHTIEGVRFPLELFLEHREITPLGTESRLTFGVPFRIGDSNQFLQRLINIADFPRRIGSRIIAETDLNVNDILGTGSLVYRYEGFQTTLPVCDPQSEWVVAYPPAEASYAQIHFISEVLLNSSANSTNLNEDSTLALAVRDTPFGGLEALEALKFEKIQDKLSKKWEKDVDSFNTLFVNPATMFAEKKDTFTFDKLLFFGR